MLGLLESSISGSDDNGSTIIYIYVRLYITNPMNTDNKNDNINAICQSKAPPFNVHILPSRP